jgi:hypothetical protein
LQVPLASNNCVDLETNDDIRTDSSVMNDTGKSDFLVLLT